MLTVTDALGLTGQHNRTITVLPSPVYASGSHEAQGQAGGGAKPTAPQL